MRVRPSMEGAESDPASSLSKEMGAVWTMSIKPPCHSSLTSEQSATARPRVLGAEDIHRDLG